MSRENILALCSWFVTNAMEDELFVMLDTTFEFVLLAA
jgi:hypothetical protein